MFLCNNVGVIFFFFFERLCPLAHGAREQSLGKTVKYVENYFTGSEFFSLTSCF